MQRAILVVAQLEQTYTFGLLRWFKKSRSAWSEWLIHGYHPVENVFIKQAHTHRRYIFL